MIGESRLSISITDCPAAQLEALLAIRGRDDRLHLDVGVATHRDSQNPLAPVLFDTIVAGAVPLELHDFADDGTDLVDRLRSMLEHGWRPVASIVQLAALDEEPTPRVCRDVAATAVSVSARQLAGAEWRKLLPLGESLKRLRIRNTQITGPSDTTPLDEYKDIFEAALAQLSALEQHFHLRLSVSADRGISRERAGTLRGLGLNSLVVGRAIWNEPSPETALTEFQQAVGLNWGVA